MYTKKKYRTLSLQARALGHESRIFILLQTKKQPRTLQEIVQMLGIKEPSASRHVHRLLHAKFLEGKRKGKSVLFRPTGEALRCSVLWESVEKGLL